MNDKKIWPNETKLTERILTFNNQDIKRDAEYPFEYKYYHALQQYGFAYSRDGMFLNVNYLGDLVHLIKKATRSSLLYTEFFTYIRNIWYSDETIKLNFQRYVKYIPNTNFSIKSQSTVDYMYTVYLAYPTFKHYLILFQNGLVGPAKENTLNILDNFNLTPQEFYDTNEIQNIFMSRINDTYASLFRNIYIEPIHEPILNTFDNIYIVPKQTYYDVAEIQEQYLNKYLYVDFNTYDDVFLNKDNNKILNTFNNIYIDKHYDTATHIFEYINVFKNVSDYKLKIFEYIPIDAHYSYNLASMENFAVEKSNKNLFLSDNESVYKIIDNYFLHIYEDVSVYSHHYFKLYINENISLSSNNDAYLALFTQEYLTKSFNHSFIQESDLASKNHESSLELYQYDMAKKDIDNKNLFITMNNDFANQYSKDIVYYQNDWSKKYFENLYLNFQNDFINKTINNKDMYLIEHESVIKYDKSLVYNEENTFIYTLWKYIELIDNKNIDISKYNFQSWYIEENIAVNKNIYNSSLYDIALSINKQQKHMFQAFTDIVINKQSKYMRDLYRMSYKYNFIGKVNKRIYINDTTEHISKVSKKIKLVNNLVRFPKESKEIIWYITNDFFSKVPYPPYISFSDFFISKQRKIISRTLNVDWVNKIRYDIKIAMNEYFANKYMLDTRYATEKYSGFLKEHRDVTKDIDQTTLIKYAMPASFYGVDKYFIVPASKIYKPTFWANAIDHITKISKDSTKFCDDTTTASKISYNMNFYDGHELFCDKMSKNIFFNRFINDSLIKSNVNIWFVNDDAFIHKYEKLSSYINKLTTGEKTNHDTTRFNELTSGLKTNKELYKQSYDFLSKTNQEIFRNNDTFIDKQSVSFERLEQVVLDIFKLGYIQQQPIPMLKDDYDIYRQKEHWLETERHLSKPKSMLTLDISKEFSINSILDLFRDNKHGVHIEDYYYLSKDLLVSKMPEIQELYKIIQEAETLTNPVLDWAWVYQDPEPFDDPFKIDELLLPENDMRYEDFENIIFDREKMRPRSPVQVINDYTFIAKYPTKYPIKVPGTDDNAYKDVALEFLDDIYRPPVYGADGPNESEREEVLKVPTNIMRKVFLGYYQIWQDHIFEFSRMTIQQSAYKILEYLYAWILATFPDYQYYAALRTFRMVRWYLERSIIQCSEYYITYEPDDLTSGKLDTSSMPIPNDMADNASMYIDTGLHVIRNNPNMLMDPDGAYLTLYIDNKRNTQISFNLNNSSQTYIMLNGTVIDRYTLPTNSRMVYNIPYTGDVNEFVIGRDRYNNHDSLFFIGNIKIEGMGTNGKLDIEFYPRIQGNKVLNHASQKVISYVNLLDANGKLLQDFLRGNVHLADVYEQLLKYWDLHHQSKEKGKRLTIKRT